MLKRLLLATALLAASQSVLAQSPNRPAVRVGVQSFLASLDPAMALGNAGFAISYNAFDTLVRRNFMSDGEGTGKSFEPGLATSWRRTDDRTLELVLREGVRFQNGDLLTSADVKFTFERILAPNSPYVSARTQLGSIERVETPDERTVRIVTKEPDAILIDLLAYPGSSIVPRKYFEDVGFQRFGQKPVGTGPYQITEFVADQTIRFTAFDGYWGGTPPASSLAFKVIPEVSARITALANREIDIATNLPPDQLQAVGALGCCIVESVPVNSHVLNYNTYNPVLQRRELRQALNLAIDRELLSKALWNGTAEILNGHQYREWGPLYNPQRPRLAHDPEKARRLIKEAGYKGEEIVLHTHPVYYTNGLQAAQAITEMWRKVGINARVQVNERWSSVPKDDPTLEARNLSDWVIVADPAATIHWSWTLTAFWQDNQAFDRLGKEARASLNQDERYRKYQAMLDMIETEAPGTVLYRAREFYGVSKQLKWRPYSLYIMDFRRDALVVD